MTLPCGLPGFVLDKKRGRVGPTLLHLVLMSAGLGSAILAVVSIAGCEPSIHPGSGVSVDRSSPDVVLSAFDQASVRRDYDAMLTYVAPLRRDAYGRFFRITRQYEVKLRELEETVRRQLGNEEASLCRLAIGQHPDPGFVHGPRIAGRIDWSKVEIITNGSTAKARVPGTMEDVIAVLLNTGGEWFIEDYAGGIRTPESLNALQGMIAGLCEEIDRAIHEVNSRRVNKANFMRFLKERFDWEPGHPTTSSWPGSDCPGAR